jgi:hypothetical protein
MGVSHATARILICHEQGRVQEHRADSAQAATDRQPRTPLPERRRIMETILTKSNLTLRVSARNIRRSERVRPPDGAGDTMCRTDVLHMTSSRPGREDRWREGHDCPPWLP